MLTVIVLSLLAAFLGSALNYQQDTSADRDHRKELLRSLIAVMLVPLFLSMASSELLTKVVESEAAWSAASHAAPPPAAKKDPSVTPSENGSGGAAGKADVTAWTQYVVSAGLYLAFCCVASVTSKRFLETITERVLRDLEQAKNDAQQAKQVAATAQGHASAAQNAADAAQLTSEQVKKEVAPIVAAQTEPGAMPHAESVLESMTAPPSPAAQQLLKAMFARRHEYTFRSEPGMLRDSGLDRLETVQAALKELRGLGLVESQESQGTRAWYLTPAGILVGGGL